MDTKYNKKNINWTFLSLTRRVCLSITFFITFILTLQTIFGRFDGIEVFAWIHLIILTLPIAFLFWADSIKNKFSGKIVSNKIHRLTIAITVTYFLLILISILIEPFFSISIITYKLISFLFIFPFEITLLIFFHNLFFKNKYNVTPSKELIEEYVHVKQECYQTNQKTLINESEQKSIFKSNCFDLVAQNELDKALSLIRTEFGIIDNSKNKGAILLQRQLNEVSKNVLVGVLDIKDAHFFYNRIAFAILEIIDE